MSPIGARALCLIAAALSAADAQPSRWIVGATPSLRIGGEGDPRTEFQWVRGVFRTANGGVVVVNAGTQELRVFAKTGEYLRSFGRRGRGPGEFENPTMFGRVGDSVFLYDYSLLRVTVLDPARGAVSTTPVAIEMKGGEATPLGRLRDGSVVFMPLRGTSMRRRGGLFRDSTDIGIAPPSLRGQPKWLGVFPYMTHLAVNPTNAERASAVGFYRFAPGFAVAVGDSCVWIGDSGSPSIVGYSPEGRPAWIARVPWAERQFDAREWDEARQRELGEARSASSRAQIEARFDTRIRPVVEPMFGQLRLDRMGNLWVERFRTISDKIPEYAVFDPQGRHVASVSLPRGLTVFEIGADYVLGTITDDDGVEVIAMYSLERR